MVFARAIWIMIGVFFIVSSALAEGRALAIFRKPADAVEKSIEKEIIASGVVESVRGWF